MAIIASVKVRELVPVRDSTGTNAKDAQLLPFLRYGQEIDTACLSVGFAPIALAPEKYLTRRTIGPRVGTPQQTNRVQKLQPLAVFPVGLFPGHILEMSCVDQTYLELVVGQHLP